MKFLFLHYSFEKDGVTRSALNTVEGLRNLYCDSTFIMAGESFSDSIPNYIEKRFINWEDENLVDRLEDVSKDADIVIIENPAVGIFPQVTLAYKQFTEKNIDKKIVYRIHDLVDDRPHLFEDFNKVFNDFNELYPSSQNVLFLTLTSFDKNRLLEKGIKNVHVLPNSIVIENLIPDKEKSFRLRKKFEEEGIINPNEKIISYPVRVLKRKNIEEALLLTKILNTEGENYRLIITIPFEADYQEEIEKLSEEFEIPCSIGKASEHIGYNKDEFTTAELFNISDLIVSTSVMEGFGLAFIEPWISGAPVIGRDLPDITKDFEDNGIDLNHLYDNSVLQNSPDSDERMSKVRRILSNPEIFEATSRNLNLKERIRKAQEVVEKNKQKVIENYGHINTAKILLNHINSK